MRPGTRQRWKNEKFDQLLVAARGESDEAKRAQMYADMQVLVHNEGGIGIPVFISQPRRAQQQAQGPDADSDRRHDGLLLRRARLARRLTRVQRR